jgi:hypothetical protein
LAVPIFKQEGLTNRNEALGLPPGSIRALISLFFIIMFVMTAVFLQSEMGSTTDVLTGVSQADYSALIASGRATGAEPDANNTWKVFVQTDASAATKEFADRIFVTLATLITALSAFYFGERAGRPDKEDKQASIRITSPDPAAPLPPLPKPGDVLEIRVVASPAAERIRASALHGTLVEDAAQPGRFTFTAGLEPTDTLDFALANRADVPSVRLELKRD